MSEASAPEDRRVAMVTGASRGIGKAAALALADASFDVVITARTVHEGEGRWDPASVTAGDAAPRVAPGSLDTTAAAIEARGQRALPVQMDLLDRASVQAAGETALREWGRVDVLVNNAIYQGPGMLDLVLDLPVELADTMVQANYLSQLVLVKAILPAMIERGGATVLNLTSGAGMHDPFTLLGEGGWSLGYGASKSAWHRVAPFLHIELGARGVRAFNVEPGFVLTETVLLSDAGESYRHMAGAPPEVIGAAIAWLATSPDAARFAGKTVHAQKLVADRGLLPGWPPPEAA